MKTKELVLSALLLGMGAVLQAVVPGLVGGMKPDFIPVMMILSFLLFPKLQNTLIVGFVAGVLAGLTGMAGAFIPNLIDKVLTALILLGLYTLFAKLLQKTAVAAIFAFVGTTISGLFFLTFASFLIELPGAVGIMFYSIVLPTAALSAIFMAVIYPIAKSLHQRTGSVNEVNNTPTV